MKTVSKAFLLSALLAPSFVFATPLEDFIDSIRSIMDVLVPIVSLLAIIYFFYGLAKYVLSAGDPAKAEEGKSIMIWGVLAMFVLVAIWGIIGFIQASTFTDTGPTNIDIDIPDVAPAEVS